MKNIIFALFALLAFLAPLPSSAEVPSQIIAQGRTSIAAMLKDVMPAVVNIVTRSEMPLPPAHMMKHAPKNVKKQMPPSGLFESVGSGVIINAAKGLIITNTHGVRYARSITVTLNDGRHFQAIKIGEDNATDIAVIKIQATDLKQIPFSNSNKVQVGDFVAAIGSPMGLRQSVTSGIVSGLHRSDLGIESLENFIQTDAPINMGNSGGALVNMNGELVGINTAILSQTGGNIGIGFAVPSNMVKSIANQLIKFGKVRRGLIGILVQTLTPDLANAFAKSNTKGAIVSQVVTHSPSQLAGIKVGDIITQINDEPINSSEDVQNTVGLVRVGDTAKITILRNNKKMHLAIKTTDPKMTEFNRRTADPYFFGINMQNVIEENPIHGYVQGIKILNLDEFSPAWASGLRRGDIVTAVNHKTVTSIRELRKIAKPNKNGVLLTIIRGKGAAFIIIK